jgi:hypothetical protein
MTRSSVSRLFTTISLILPLLYPVKDVAAQDLLPGPHVRSEDAQLSTAIRN